MNFIKKYRGAIVGVLTLAIIQLFIHDYGVREVIISAAIYLIGYFAFFPVIERLSVFMTNPKKDELYK